MNQDNWEEFLRNWGYIFEVRNLHDRFYCVELSINSSTEFLLWLWCQSIWKQMLKPSLRENTLCLLKLVIYLKNLPFLADEAMPEKMLILWNVYLFLKIIFKLQQKIFKIRTKVMLSTKNTYNNYLITVRSIPIKS